MILRLWARDKGLYYNYCMFSLVPLAPLNALHTVSKRLRNSQSSQRSVSNLLHHFPGRRYYFLLSWRENKASLSSKVGTFSIFQDCLPSKYPWKDRNKSYQCLYSKNVQKQELPMEKCLPTTLYRNPSLALSYLLGKLSLFSLVNKYLFVAFYVLLDMDDYQLFAKTVIQ